MRRALLLVSLLSAHHLAGQAPAYRISHTDALDGDGSWGYVVGMRRTIARLSDGTIASWSTRSTVTCTVIDPVKGTLLTDNGNGVEIRAKAPRVTGPWSTAPCKNPVAMGIDISHQRLFMAAA